MVFVAKMIVESVPDQLLHPHSMTAAVLDHCGGCGDVCIEVTVEEVGRAGGGEVAHLSPDGAHHLRQALTKALTEISERA